MERHNSGIQGNAHKSQEPQSRQLESRAQDERAISLLVVGAFRITSHGKPTTGQVAAGCPVGFRVFDYSGVGKRHQRTWPWQRLSLVTDAETLQLTLKSDSRGNARVHYQSRGVFATLTA